MIGLTTILGAASGLLLLAAVGGGGFAFLRLHAVTGRREWLWALGAVGLSLACFALSMVAIFANTLPAPFQYVDGLHGIISNLGTIAQSAIFLAVARASVVMARREAEKPEP